MTDAIDAVTACAACLRHHCAALLERAIWSDAPPSDDDPPPPATFTADPEE